MASVAGAGAAPIRPARLETLRRRLVPAEGWTTVLLHAIVVLAAAWTVERAEWAPDRVYLAVVALGGLLVGLVLAKLRAPDLFAHLVAFWTGIGIVLLLAIERLSAVPGGRRERLLYLWALGLDWYRDLVTGRRLDEPELLTAILGLTVWLVAYTSAWTLYRRGWLTTAIVLPGIIAVVNLGYAPEAGTAPLLVYVVAACLLAARHHAFRRERDWARSRLPRPALLPWRFLTAGANLALLAAILAWTLPLSARDELAAAVWSRIEQPWSTVADRWQDWFADWAGPNDVGGSYATFGEKFRLGGALNLSDDPALLLQTGGARPRPTYLIGHRYDRYDGHGWSSDVDATFAPNGQNGGPDAPEISFATGQAVHLTTDVLTDRSEVKGTVTVLRPKGDLIFSTDTYEAVDRQTDVQLSWRQLNDEPFDLRVKDGNPAPTVNAIPVDLRQFASLLIRARFPAPPAGQTTDSPDPTDPALAEQIAKARTGLRDRFLDVRWDVGPDGTATTLYATGQLPVYDDVEAVFAVDPVAQGGSYTVTALASAAGPGDLRQAGTDYPTWVTDRYLGLPESVTERTRELARQLAAGQPTPFDVAMTVQTFVRERIAYTEQIDAPPRDQDVVDYVLFDSQQGYCEYYASAMAVLLRADGIPARVVAGYFPVPFDPGQGGFLYREKNAHLWVEVFFPGYGWIPFEPTAARSPLSYGDLAAPTTPLATPTAVPTTAATAEATPPPAPTEPPAAGPVTGTPWQPPRAALGWATLLAGLLLMLGIGVGSAIWFWGFRGLTPTGGFYARALRAGRWSGVRVNPAMTPREYADRLGEAIPATRAPARVVADLYSRELYAGQPSTAATIGAARAAWTQLRQAFLRSLVRRRRGAGEHDRA